MMTLFGVIGFIVVCTFLVGASMLLACVIVDALWNPRRR